MNARISRLTILSETNYALGRFYEGFFHMRPRGTPGATEAVRLSDGRIGLDIEPRLAGQPAQLDRFAIEVEDMGRALARIGEGYPAIEWQDGGGGPGAASVTTHDPDGDIFVLCQRGSTDREGRDGREGGTRDRVIDHLALRVLHPDRVAEFYAGVFGFGPRDGPAAGGNVYLSDGNVTLAIIPWRMSDFEDTGISARGLDHIGFRVESIAALKSDIEGVTARNPRFRPSNTVVGRGKEGAGRLAMFKRTCPLGRHHLADSDGLLLDVRE